MEGRLPRAALPADAGGRGDCALFFRKAAIEISFEDEQFLVVPYGAILVLVRTDGAVPDQLPQDL